MGATPLLQSPPLPMLLPSTFYERVRLADRRSLKCIKTYVDYPDGTVVVNETGGVDGASLSTYHVLALYNEFLQPGVSYEVGHASAASTAVYGPSTFVLVAAPMQCEVVSEADVAV